MMFGSLSVHGKLMPRLPRLCLLLLLLGPWSPLLAQVSRPKMLHGPAIAKGKVLREVWQDRLMEMEGAAAKELTQLHGELIAFAWIEQNTGNTAVRTF